MPQSQVHGKRDCMDVIGKRSQDVELMLDLSGWVWCHHKDPNEGKNEAGEAMAEM